MSKEKILEAKQCVLQTSQKAFEAKLFAGTSGNLSVYLREEGLVVITPTCVRYETMTLDDIVVIDVNGNIAEGKYKPSSEWMLHCELYKSRPEAGAVVHTHSPYATAFAAANRRIPAVLTEMVPFLGGDVPVAPVQLPGTPAVGQSAVQAIAGRNACLLGNHGAVAVGRNMDEAYIRAEYIEDAAKIALLAIQVGGGVPIPQEIEERLHG